MKDQMKVLKVLVKRSKVGIKDFPISERLTPRVALALVQYEAEHARWVRFLTHQQKFDQIIDQWRIYLNECGDSC